MKQPIQQIVLVILATALPALAEAQESPYAGLEQRPIKTLSPEEVAGYAEGVGASLALAAELNGYAGPRHLPDDADALGSSEDQREAISAVFAAMRSHAIAVGRQYLRAERQVDSLFAAKGVTAGNLQDGVAAAESLKGSFAGHPPVCASRDDRAAGRQPDLPVPAFAWLRGSHPDHEMHH